MHAIKRCILSREHFALLNVVDLFFSKFGVTLVLSARGALLAASSPDAGWGIAGVQDTKSWRYRPPVQLIGNPVGQQDGAGMSPFGDLAIALVVNATVPQPASRVRLS